MPAQERTPDAPISDDLILAATERAEHHQDPERDPGIGLSTIKRLLSLPHHGGTTRRLRPQLRALEHAELITQFRRKGTDLIALTDEGRRQRERGSRSSRSAPTCRASQVRRRIRAARFALVQPSRSRDYHTGNRVRGIGWIRLQHALYIRGAGAKRHLPLHIPRMRLAISEGDVVSTWVRISFGAFVVACRRNGARLPALITWRMTGDRQFGHRY